MPSKTVTVQIHREGSMCFIPVPFDPKPVFGKIRAPVKVTINGHTYRSTISSMGNYHCIPLRRSNREAAGLDGTEKLAVTIELDSEVREVTLPADLREALLANPASFSAWQQLSYTHRREHVEALQNAKKPETRGRRLSSTLRFLAERAKERT